MLIAIIEVFQECVGFSEICKIIIVPYIDVDLSSQQNLPNKSFKYNDLII